MKKEIIVSIIIVIAVIIGNAVTQNYTTQCASKMTQELSQLKEEIQNNKYDGMEEKMNKINEQWYEMQEKLAFYIEHNELEKVETQLMALKGNIESELQKESIPEIEKCIFMLKHIQDKSALDIKNFF